MNKEQTIAFLKKEIAKLNKIIDQKILLGKNWSEESKKHRQLVDKIRNLTDGSIYA
jgi:hypothetical protein